jgi:CelD/BcsL family acetyltransferase involved in cellulose biosynthesis
LAEYFSSSRPSPGLPADASRNGEAFATVEVHTDPAPILAAWAELENAAPVSVYQTRRFLLPWIKSLGAWRNVTPVFVAARDR